MNRSRRAAKSLKWWRRWSDSTMRSSPLRRTGRCWRAMRIYPAETSSVPSSNGSSHNRPVTRTRTTTTSRTRPDNEVGEHDRDDTGGAMSERKPNLRPVRELTPSLQFRTIHGYRRAFRVAGSGPAILLIHGIGDNSTTWSTVQTKLAQRFTVIAPDLLGHGKSDKPRADYSVAAYANGMRDLLSVLGIDSVALALLRLPLVLPALQIIGRIGGAIFGSTGMGRDIPNMLRILEDLPEPTASAAFARTLRAVVDWRGQVVTMLDRCYLTQSVPVQLIWGARDSVIPVSHAKMAHSAMPGSQLEIFEGSGHFPFHDDPDRFVEVVERFIDSTDPAVYDQEYLRSLLRAGISEGAISGPG